MRALSWKQPFATAMLFGKIETRSWNTNYRGPVLICSSKKQYDQNSLLKIQGKKLIDYLCSAMNKDTGTLYKYGYAIAVAELVDCRPMVREDELKTFVKFKPGLFVHVYANVRPIDPFPWKGSQGWREVSEEVQKGIAYV